MWYTLVLQHSNRNGVVLIKRSRSKEAILGRRFSIKGLRQSQNSIVTGEDTNLLYVPLANLLLANLPFFVE